MSRFRLRNPYWAMTSAATSIVLFATWAPWAIPLGFIAMYSFPMLAARRH